MIFNIRRNIIFANVNTSCLYAVIFVAIFNRCRHLQCIIITDGITNTLLLTVSWNKLFFFYFRPSGLGSFCRRVQMVSDAARCWQMVLDDDNWCQMIPDDATGCHHRCSHLLPHASRCSKMLPGAHRCCQIIPDTTDHPRCNSCCHGSHAAAARFSRALTDPARCSRIPRDAPDCQSAVLFHLNEGSTWVFEDHLCTDITNHEWSNAIKHCHMTIEKNLSCLKSIETIRNHSKQSKTSLSDVKPFRTT